MNSVPENNISLIQKTIEIYLAENRLSKMAYFTNKLPSANEKKYISDCFCYMCYCMKNSLEKYEVYFLVWKYGYNKIPYDVHTGKIEDFISRRGAYGYVSLKLNNSNDVESTINHLITHKKNINNQYSILLNVICQNDSISNIVLPANCKDLKIISDYERLLRIV
jgi:hypothetical protein